MFVHYDFMKKGFQGSSLYFSSECEIFLCYGRLKKLSWGIELMGLWMHKSCV